MSWLQDETQHVADVFNNQYEKVTPEWAKFGDYQKHIFNSMGANPVLAYGNDYYQSKRDGSTKNQALSDVYGNAGISAGILAAIFGGGALAGGAGEGAGSGSAAGGSGAGAGFSAPASGSATSLFGDAGGGGFAMPASSSYGSVAGDSSGLSGFQMGNIPAYDSMMSGGGASSSGLDYQKLIQKGLQGYQNGQQHGSHGGGFTSTAGGGGLDTVLPTQALEVSKPQPLLFGNDQQQADPYTIAMIAELMKRNQQPQQDGQDNNVQY